MLHCSVPCNYSSNTHNKDATSLCCSQIPEDRFSLVEAHILFICLASFAMSTGILKAFPGKLDIKRHSPSVLYFYLPLEDALLESVVGGIFYRERCAGLEDQTHILNASVTHLRLSHRALLCCFCSKYYFSILKLILLVKTYLIIFSFTK